MANEENLALAIGLSIGSGLSTTVGGLSVFCDSIAKAHQSVILSSALALSSGVMLYVSFVEIFRKAQDAIALELEGGVPLAVTTVCFFGGMGLCALLELGVHRIMRCAGSKHTHGIDKAEEDATPHSSAAPTSGGERDALELARVEVVAAAIETGEERNDISEAKRAELSSTGILTALAIALHNFPEGLATFIATLAEPALGIALAVAIAVHNVPEGMAVAMPVYYASGSKVRAFLLSTVSGITEPIGGILGWLILREAVVDSNLGFGIVFASVGGMMVFIVIHEMMPVAVRYEPRQVRTTGFVVLGMMIMAASLVLFVV